MSAWYCPRSIIFVPGDKPELVSKALRSQACAVCIDLEDGVAPQNKASARVKLTAYALAAKSNAIRLWVRLNADLIGCAADIRALPQGIEAVVLPKARGWSHIHYVLESLTAQFSEQQSFLGIIPMVEDIAALGAIKHSAVVPARGVLALALGPEDLASDLGVQPTPELLRLCFYDLVKAARAVDIPVLGFPGSIAEFRDLSAVSIQLQEGKKLGAQGAFCIHPNQVAVVNSTFSVSEEEIEWAQAVEEAVDDLRRNGVAIHSLTKQMIDAPVIKRASYILRRAGLNARRLEFNAND